MKLDVQYGSAAASAYDPLISLAVPPDDAIARLRPYITDARVLEIGIGTGRVGLAAAALASELVGLDNSEAMLEVCRAKQLPANLSLVKTDFRQALSVEGPFDVAYSTMGSLTCVESTDELVSVLERVAKVLRPGGVLVMDYYATSVYRPLIEAHKLAVPTPDQRGVAHFTVTLDDADIMTMVTRIEAEGQEPVEFAERVLLIERPAVEASLAAAGFSVEQVQETDGTQAYDWYVARRSG